MALEPLARRIAPLPASPYAEAALQRLSEAARRGGDGERLDALLLHDEGLREFLGSALGDCPFLLDLAAKDTRRLAEILAEASEDRLAAQVGALVRARWGRREEALAALRLAKQNVALTLGLADLGRAIPLQAATGALTDFADAALQAALRFALEEAERSGKWTGDGETPGLFILALGKHGAHELNYSSDIDVIALYEPGAPGLSEGVEPSGFWVRVVRAVVALLQERTADGYVFRTDLRLRPDPGATPVALSAPAALLY